MIGFSLGLLYTSNFCISWLHLYSTRLTDHCNWNVSSCKSAYYKLAGYGKLIVFSFATFPVLIFIVIRQCIIIIIIVVVFTVFYVNILLIRSHPQRVVFKKTRELLTHTFSAYL